MKSATNMTQEQIEQTKISGWSKELEKLKQREKVYRLRYGEDIPEFVKVDEKAFWEQKWAEDRRKTLSRERFELVRQRYGEVFGSQPRLLKRHTEIDSQGIVWGYKDNNFHQDRGK